MAVRTYTGKLVGFDRNPFPPSEAVDCYVKAEGDAFGPVGLYANRKIPITVASDGSFTVSLEASTATRNPARYTIIADWLDKPNGQSVWKFIAPNESGDLGLIAATGLGIDTDGTPFFDPGSWGPRLKLDTDGTPYFTIGA